MRLKFLLFAFLLWAGILSAQDTINYLVITEYRGDNTHNTYLELTNMGDKPVQLNQFEIGQWGGGALLNYETGITNRDGIRIPVDKLLQPGESYVFAAADEYGPKKFAEGLEGFQEKLTQDNIWKSADFLVHLPEGLDDGTDIVTPGLYKPFNEQWGANGFFIEQHFPNGDSMVVDQVGGMFSGAEGANLDRTSPDAKYNVAGVPDAIRNAYLIRKSSVKTGNLDFNNSRGVGLDDSEWIPIPIHGAAWRLAPWTVGNQGDFNLDANTLESDVIEVDFANMKLNVPWGVQRGDDIMNYFVQKPGIGWEYIMAADGDSLTHAAQTGDQLLIYVCGNDLDLGVFDIIIKEPTANANMVVPVTNEDPEGAWRDEIDGGQWAWPRVTRNESGIDSIWGTRGGIPYATRVDSLLERLDKPTNAEWEIVYASGVAKPDLAQGDKLKITAKDGSVKEYLIPVLDYRANSDASLTSITWPDIPEFYKGIFGWMGDTIPNFGSQVFNYNVEVPVIAEGIPHFVTKKSDVNAKVHVERAKSLSGSLEDRTTKFTVTAEDDSTKNNYSIILTKETSPDKVQPYHAEPFISEVTQNYWWSGTDMAEICNPGNQPLDLSDYMLASSSSVNPADVIAITNETNWKNRYDKYIPGYKWASTDGEWVTGPYIAQLDLAVNAIVLPGDVFVLGSITNADCDWPGYPANTQLDVQFNNLESACRNYVNQWGEDMNQGATAFGKWHTNPIYLFKILNDSIKRGLKPATDPNDFDLIDVLGKEDGSIWKLGDKNIGNPFALIRKPEIYKGNPVVGVALGTSPEDAEYEARNLDTYAALGFGWPWRMRNIVSDIGKHYFITPTQYMSTVNSVVYKVSPGYGKDGMKENIKGITTGTTVGNFMDNLIKANEMQTLTVMRGDGELAMDAGLNMDDVLVVLSADSANTTKYLIEVSDEGLSSNAVLTSAKYDIAIISQPKSGSENENAGTATVSGFDYGTSLKTILANITVPPGARMDVIDGNGAYVPLTVLNFDTAYVNITVNADTYLDVIAENGVTEIVYQMIPNVSESSAFVTSDLYSVSQKDFLINFVPRGINVQSFMSNLFPSFGASMILVDKMGFERTEGTVADDDKVIVTSANNVYSMAYHISKLATQYLREPTYLAYILSKTYMIDQVDYVIDGVSSEGTLTDFYSKITTSMGANAVVVDKDGMGKTTDNISGSDMVKVTSADGRIVVTYTFGHVVSANAISAKNIELYPNPSNGRLNVTGLEKGQRIQVYNSVGSAIVDINVESNLEIVNLDAHPAGMYLIVISNKNRPIGRYKAIKY